MAAPLNPEAKQLLKVGFSVSDNPHFLHLRSKLTVLTYLRIADEIAGQLAPERGVRILDWGAGAGQMSYLLKRRGLDVTSYFYQGTTEDVKPGTHLIKEITRGTYNFGGEELPQVCSYDPVNLPFPDGYFEAVLSCGVLEHVSDEKASLGEVRRVLKPGGVFLVYQLPQKGSWLEFVIKQLKLGYAHERKYSGRGVRRLLAGQGFEVEWLRRANMLPKSFTGLPTLPKKIFETQPDLVLKTDSILARVPLLNLAGGVLELSARRQ